jgi:hypothetical protein
MPTFRHTFRQACAPLGLGARDGNQVARASTGGPATNRSLACLLAEIFRCEFPIDQLIEHGIDVVGPLVLVVEIVRVLPHVDGQERL